MISEGFKIDLDFAIAFHLLFNISLIFQLDRFYDF